MKKQKLLLVIVLLGLFPVLHASVPDVLPLPVTDISQQSKQITGVIVDDFGDPIIGANVVEKGTLNGTMTDLDGRFSLTVSNDAVLQISYIGYVNQEITVGSQSQINVILREDTQTLDEVVVVGFGTQKKVNLTGAVGTVNSESLEARPVMLASQALQGLVPGLNITQTNGSLETRANISIRGTGTIADGSSSSPLVLIDGMEGDINAINPQDIESISVLKDAAAASIYGSRAPFGVILITTKKGSSGKTVVNYNNSFRWNTPLIMPKFMDSYTFALYFNDAAINGGVDPHFSDAWLANILAYQQGTLKDPTVAHRNNGRWEEGFDPNGVNNTGGNDNRDYYRELYRSSAFAQEHNVSISGGNDRVTYYTSFNILDQDGLMQFNQDYYQRYAATAKIGFDATKYLRVNYSNRFVRDKYKRPSDLKDSLFEDIGRQGWPILPLYDPNGNLQSRLALGLRDGGEDKTETDNLYQQIQFILEPVKNWKTFAEVNYSIKNLNRHWDKQVTYMYDVAGNPYVWNQSSNVHEEYEKQNRMGVNLYSEYAFSLNNSHNFKAMAGIQYESAKQTKFGLQRDGIMVPGINEVDGTSGTDYDGEPVTPSVNGERNRWATFGYFARINYDYKGRYLLEVNLRNDGSSRFRKGNRWVVSPSFSAGWNIAQEDFWEPIQDIVNTLKVRASYGQLANQNTSSWYPTYAAMAVKSAEGVWLQNGTKPNVSWSPLTLVTEDLTWEKIRTFNVGLDFGLLNNRLTGSFDYFVRNTVDMLGPAPQRPVALGVKVPRANNTDLKDYGFELQVEWRDRLRNGLGYGVKVTLSDYQTEIKKYPNLTGNIGGTNTYNAGRKMNEIWGYETIGIARTQEEMDAHLAKVDQSGLGSNWGAGDIMYADLDGNGRISEGGKTLDDPGDLKVIGNSTPRYHIGFELTADYKGFDLRAFFQGVLKRDYWQDSYSFWGVTKTLWWSTGFTDHEDYFRDSNTTSVANGALQPNINSYYPRPVFESDKNQQKQSGYLQNAAYLRLKNLQLGYTLPAHVTNKIYLSRVRFYVSGENLVTFTKMSSIFDPETVSGGKGGSVYPLSRVISFGVNVNF